MMGMAATNKQVNIQGIDYLYFKEGKCTEHWGYMDIPKLMQQLGMSKDNK
jgi:predicted ester cyclase